MSLPRTKVQHWRAAAWFALCVGCSGSLGAVEEQASSLDAGTTPEAPGQSSTTPSGAGAPAPNAGAGDDAQDGSPSNGPAGTSDDSAHDDTSPDALPTNSATNNTPDETGALPGTATSACTSGNVDPGPAPLRLLTREQYLNTLTSLFGSVPDLSAALSSRVPSLDIGAGQGDVSQVELEDFGRAAELVAASAVAGEALTTLAPCATERAARDCARDFVLAFTPRAYRAPITDEADIERHLALFDIGAETDFRHGIELLLRGVLQSSRFLYKVELGQSEPQDPTEIADAVRLSGHELAARLSYAFWQAPPDDTLVRAAEDGSLATDTGLDEAAQRVLQDPRAEAAVRGFLETLTHLGALRSLNKNPTLFPEWQANALPASLQAQAQRFFDYVLDEEQGRLSTLLTSPRVYVNANLATYYGAEGVRDEFEPLDMNATAAGLLTLPAFLAWAAKPDEGSPIYRGKFVREMLLCQIPPAPPAEIPAPPAVDPNVSTRERLSQHEADPACSGCHSLMDPIGLGFEHYDAIGRYRSEDGAQPVDASGELIGTRALDGEFDGVQELAARLSDSDEVRSCIARQYFRYVLQRFDVAQDACSLQRLTTAFVDADANLNTLPAAIIKTDAFSYRRPVQTAASN